MIASPIFRTTNAQPSRFASSEEFGKLFDTEAPSLFQLAFVLTGDRNLAEQCFMTALEACLNAPTVVREWAYRWARRAVIRTAVQLLGRRKGSGHPQSRTEAPEFDAAEVSMLYQILSLPEFERLVYVLSVLEGYSKVETAVLLGRFPRDVQEARTQAVLRLSPAAVRENALGSRSVS